MLQPHAVGSPLERTGDSRDGPRISGHALGLVLGTFIGGWHVLWSLLVLVGWAQGIIDFIFWLHFLAPPYRVGTFGAWRAGALIAVTSTLGYVFGRIIGALWDAVHDTRRG